ncbi:MAG: RHS repeat-associated core domain-containing protein, partial [Thermoanaerobaculia bacterium]
MRYVRGRDIDEIVRAERSSGYDGRLDQLFFPLQDELGNVDRLTDGGGATLERYEYEGYGQFHIFTATSVEQPFGAYGWKWLFQGREYDRTLNAYDFRARTLWPELGRFGQEDPADAGDSANRYQAFLGDWTGKTDPRGEDTMLILYGEGYLSTQDIGRDHDVGNNFQLAAETRARELQPLVDRMNVRLRAQGKKGADLWYIAGPLRVPLRDDLIREVNGRRGSGPIRELHVFSHGWQGGLNLGGSDRQNWQLRNLMVSDIPRISLTAFTKGAEANFFGCNTANTSEGPRLQQAFGTSKPFAQVFSETLHVRVNAFTCSSHFDIRGKNVYQVPDRKQGTAQFTP